MPCALWSNFTCITSFVSHHNSAKHEEMVSLMLGYVWMDFYIIWYSLINFQKEGNTRPVFKMGKLGLKRINFSTVIGESIVDKWRDLDCHSQRKKPLGAIPKGPSIWPGVWVMPCAIYSMKLWCVHSHSFIHPFIHLQRGTELYVWHCAKLINKMVSKSKYCSCLMELWLFILCHDDRYVLISNCGCNFHSSGC